LKIEAVRLIRDRGVNVAQAARDLDFHENVLRKWVRDHAADPAQAFPGHGQIKPERLEIERLKREVAKLRAERDILKKAAAYFARDVTEVCGYCEGSFDLAGGLPLQCAGCVAVRLPCLAQ
jgi:transposase